MGDWLLQMIVLVRRKIKSSDLVTGGDRAEAIEPTATQLQYKWKGWRREKCVLVVFDTRCYTYSHDSTHSIAAGEDHLKSE